MAGRPRRRRRRRPARPGRGVGAPGLTLDTVRRSFLGRRRWSFLRRRRPWLPCPAPSADAGRVTAVLTGRLFDPGADPAARLRFVQALSEIPDPSVPDLLRRLARDPDPGVARVAAALAGALRRPAQRDGDSA
ncbi:HEAT repeat domain-containing protein [Streptomyces sp. NPDC006186]|uniref:HEAT repeat domain-containing protein n=1 Tax=Streptomyces sp. NPDC006186 TaxID=3155248 RepID=UPI0033A1271E